MTVSSQTPLASSTANGVTTVFPHAFTVLQAVDLVVIGTLNGVTTTYVNGVDYTITGLGLTSGSVVFTVAPANGTVVVRYRNTAIQRSTDYQNNGDLLAAVVNLDFDRIWLVLQEVLLGNKAPGVAVRAPPGELLPELPSAAGRANRLLSFDSAGDPIMVVPTAGTAAALAVDLASATAAKGAMMVGYLPAGAGAAATRTVSDKLREIVSVADYTAGSDAGTAFNAALAQLTTLGGGILLIPPGTYIFTSTQTLSIPANTYVLGYGATLDFSGATRAGRVRITGSVGSNLLLTANVAVGDSVIPLASVTGLAPGDVIRISSTALVRLAAIGGSTTQQIGELVVIRSISGLNVTIEGYLDGSYATADTASAVKLNTRDGVTIEGITIKGAGPLGTNTSSAEVGIWALYCRDFEVRNVEVELCDYNGIRVEQSFGWTVDSCRVRHAYRGSDAFTAVIQYGVSIVGVSTRGVVRDCNLIHGKHGVAWSENSLPGIGRDVTVDGNHITGTWAAAIATHESNDRCTVTRNNIIGCFRGVDCRIRNMIISDNAIRNIPGLTGDAGIYLQENAGDILIQGNRIDGARFGIRAYNTGFPVNARPVDIVVRGNTIQNINQGAIIFEQTQNVLGFSGIVVADNHIRGFGSNGVQFNGEFIAPVVTGNYFYCDSAPAGYGVQIGGTLNARVFGNTFTNMVPVRLENDTNGVPRAPRNPILANNSWDHTTAFVSQAAGTQVVKQDNVEIGDSNLVIAAGIITVPTGVRYIIVDTEAAAATDDLDTINGGDTGDFITVTAASSARDVVLRDGVGNLQLNGNFTLTHSDDTITLLRFPSGWREMARSDNSV